MQEKRELTQRERNVDQLRGGEDTDYLRSPMKLLSIDVRFEYPVHFTSGVFETANDTLAQVIHRKEPRRRHRVMLVLDRGVTDTRPASWRRDFARYFEIHGIDLVAEIVLEGGEGVKSDRGALEALLSSMDEHGMDRQSFVVIVGGGAVLDMAGYAAAIAHRGIRVIRVPTTVLAQADSGIGVKNGVNAFGKKNFVGTFSPPFAVINDARFFETLGRRDLVAGMAEAVKVSLIRDRTFFQWLRRQSAALAACDLGAITELVRRSAELHLNHIATSGDPFELGSSRPLDFGHWAAHKLESMTNHRLRHGEAVAIGLAIDTLYSAAQGLCREEVAEAVLGTLERIGFALWDEALEERIPGQRPRILEGLEEFREHLGGELTLTMLRDIGEAIEIHEVDEPLLVSCLDVLRSKAARVGAA
jgi:3-dehydroquinate synthase